jgi:hypothetical protein
MHFSTTDDNKEPDSQYEAFLAAYAEEDDDESFEKTKNKHRSRFARSTKRRNKYEEESDEESDYNPAEPQSSRSPDSYTRRQEFLAKVAAAAGSKYTC